MFNTQYINFESAVLLKEIGFNHVTNLSIVKYTDDYVYDSDPEHPESHKAGEIRVDRHSWVPNEHTNAYPMISITDAIFWLLHEYGYNIYTRLYKYGDDTYKWAATIEKYQKNKDGKWTINENLAFKEFTGFEDSDDCLEFAVYQTLYFIKNNKWNYEAN